jgi:hypothetical protein
MALTNSSTELVDAVRHWVHFDNLAESLNKQVINARNMRNTFEKKVLTLLDTIGMHNATLKITGATLQRATKPKQTDLSWSFLENSLHEYHKTIGKSDDTDKIIAFIQKQRIIQNVEYLKKTSNT